MDDFTIYRDLALLTTQVAHDSSFEKVCTVHIKTHDGDSRGQEEANLCDKPVNYLHVALL